MARRLMHYGSNRKTSGILIRFLLIYCGHESTRELENVKIGVV